MPSTAVRSLKRLVSASIRRGNDEAETETIGADAILSSRADSRALAFANPFYPSETDFLSRSIADRPLEGKSNDETALLLFGGVVAALASSVVGMRRSGRLTFYTARAKKRDEC
jgi:hypothetical protein